MIAVLSLVVVLLLSVLVVRIATVALTLTGLSRSAAQFQARSAWTGTGFTTAESERVVNHPVRRQIISWLIFLRNAGLVTAASTLVLSFVNVEQSGQGWTRFLLLFAGLALVFALARSQWLDRRLSPVIAWALKRFTDLDTRDYAGLLHLAGEYAISEVALQPGTWLADKELRQLKLRDEGVVVLGVTRPDGTYLGAPKGDTPLAAGDSVLLYGRSSRLTDVTRRRAAGAGDAAHVEAVADQHQVERQDAEADSRR